MFCLARCGARQSRSYGETVSDVAFVANESDQVNCVYQRAGETSALPGVFKITNLIKPDSVPFQVGGQGCFIVQPEGFALSLEQLCCAALMRLFVFLVALFFCHERHEIYEKYFRR
jgi:hypothetical protein